MDPSADVTAGKRRRFKPFVIKKGIVVRAKQMLRKAHELSKSRNDSTSCKDPQVLKLKTNNRSLSKALADQRIECNTLFEEKLRLQDEMMRNHEVIFALRKEVQAHEADFSHIQDVFHGSLQLLMTLTDQLNTGMKYVNDGRRRSRSVSLGTTGGRLSKSSGQHRPGPDGAAAGCAPTSRKLHKVLPTVAGNVISHPSIVLPRLPAGSGWLGAAPTGPRRVATPEDTEEDETEEQDETEEEEEEVSDAAPVPGGRLQVSANAGDLSIILEQSVMEERSLSPLRQAQVVVPARERLSGDQAWLQLSGRRSRRSGRRRRSSESAGWRRQVYPGLSPGSPAPLAAGGSRPVRLSPQAGPSTSPAGLWTAAGSPAPELPAAAPPRLSAADGSAGFSPIISGSVSICRPSVMEASPGSTQYSLLPMELESESDAADLSAAPRRRRRRSRAIGHPAESATAPTAAATAEAGGANTTAELDDSVVITRKIRRPLGFGVSRVADAAVAAAAAAAAPAPEEPDRSVVLSRKTKRSRLPVAVQARRAPAAAAPAPASTSSSPTAPAAAASSVEAAAHATSAEDTTTTAAVAPAEKPDSQKACPAPPPAEPASASAGASPEADLDLSVVSVVVAARKPRRGRQTAAASAAAAPEPEADPDRSVVVPTRRTGRTEANTAASADADDAAEADPVDSAQSAAASAGEVDTSPTDAFSTPSPQIGLKEPRRAQQLARPLRGTAFHRAIAPARSDDPLEGPSNRVWLAPRGGGGHNSGTSPTSRPAPVDGDVKLTGQPVVVMDRSLLDSPEFKVAAAARRAVNGDRRVSLETGRLAAKRRQGAAASSAEDVISVVPATPDDGGGDGAVVREPARKRGRKKKSGTGKGRDRRKRAAEEAACSAGVSGSVAAVKEERPHGDEGEVAASDAPAAPPGENGVRGAVSDAEHGTGDGCDSRSPDRELTDPSRPEAVLVDSGSLNSGVTDNADSGAASVPSGDQCPSANLSPEANCPDTKSDPPARETAGRSVSPPEVDLVSWSASPEVAADGGQCDARDGDAAGASAAAESQPAGLAAAPDPPTVVGEVEAAAWPEGLLRISTDPTLPPGPASPDVQPSPARADGTGSDSSRPSSTEPDQAAGRPRRRKPVSYREPSLTKKLRR